MSAIADVSPRRLPAPRLADVLLAAALCAFALLEVALGHPGRLWPDVLLVAAVTLPLALRRLAPLVCALAVSAALLAQALGGGKASTYTFLLVGVLVALYSLGAHAPQAQRVIGLLAALAAAVASALAGPGHGVSDALFAAGVVVLPWTVGVVSHRRRHAVVGLRERAERLEREQGERERAAVAAERARIARELHDIVAHAVTLMVVQANAGERQVRSDPAAAERAFAVVREQGKGALTELRRMLDLLRSDESAAETVTPQPSLAMLEQLVEDARRTGADVTLEVDGLDDVAVPESVVVALYRLVQEALTNAGRHAHGAPVSIQVGRRADGLRLLVRNGRGARVADVPGSGYGLVGMRERVAVFGGTFAASPQPDGSFAVEVVLPLGGAT